MTSPYNLLRIALRKKLKITFRTRYADFEYQVMHFGLTNAPTDFQHFINNILIYYLNMSYIAYFINILIYSDTLEDNKKYFGLILQAITKAGVFLTAEKCQFHFQETKYLCLIISKNCIKMYPTKVDAVRN